MSSSTGPLFQNSVYVGINLNDILYGVELVLYFKTMRVLLSSKTPRKRIDVFYAIFSTVMMTLITVWVSTQAVFGERMWLIDVPYSGGPDSYWASHVSVWYMDLGTTAVAILQLMTDGLMIYRCRTIWGGYRIIILPVILWLCTAVLGILVIVMTSVPGGNFFGGVAAQVGLSYYCVTVALTVMLTGIICHCMVTHGLEMKKQLGKDYATVYFALLGLVIESVLPYSLSGIAFLVSFGAGNKTSIAFGCVYIMMMCISPQMLILRCASGRGWDDETGKVGPSSLKFNTVGEPSVWTESRGFEESGTTLKDAV